MSLDQTIDALTKLLENGDEADRCYVTQALGKLTDPSIAPAISKRVLPYLRDKDIDVCVDAAATLGKLGGVGVTAALVESLEKDPDGEVKTAIARALGDLGDIAAVPELVRVMEERDEGIEIIEDGWDLWWDVQLAAVKSLGKLKAADAVPALERVLNSIEGEDIEPDILRSLAEIGTEESIQALERILTTGDVRKQRRAATALGRSDSAEAVKILGRALSSKHVDVRVHATKALEELDAKKYLPAIMLLLKNPSDEVRSAAAHAATTLGEMKNPTQEAVDLFTGLLDDESALVRATSLNTLANLRREVLREKIGDKVIDRVIELVGDSDIETSTAATRLFSKLNTSDAEDKLVAILDDDSNETAIRRQAALSLAVMDQVTDSGVTSLTNALSDPEQSVRLAALVSMMDCEDKYIASNDDGETHPRPIEIILSALHGEIDLTREEEETGERAPQSQEVQFNKDVDLKAAESDSSDGSNSDNEEESQKQVLPDFPESPTVEGERHESLSTLDTIAMDNVETALMLDEDEAPVEEEHDEETKEYLNILDNNEEAAVRRERRFKNKDIHTDVRRMAATILGRKQSDLAIDELNHALNDDDHEIRRLAAEALAEIATSNPSNPKLLDTQGTLISQVHFGDPDIRMASIRALGAMENRAAIPTLIDRLDDDDTVVRMESVRALASIASSKLDSDSEAHMVTNEISNGEILQKISEKLEDDQPSVRKYAADAITTLLSSSEDNSEESKSLILKILDAGFAGAGEQARHMGRALRILDPVIGANHLLPLLESMQSSAERRFVIEMLEEIYQTDQASEQRDAA